MCNIYFSLQEKEIKKELEKVKKLEGSLEEKDREIAELRANCAIFSNSWMTTNSQLVEAQKRLSEMSSRTEGTSLGQKLAEAEGQRDRLQMNWIEKCARMEDLEKRLQQKDEELNNLRRELENFRVVLETWSNQVSGAEKKLKERSSEIERLEARLARTGSRSSIDALLSS